MAKLTVYFKNKIVSSHLIETEKVRIGRDETNDVVINSPELAPVHAVLITYDDGYVIKQLNNDFPLVLNGKHTKEHKLLHSDTITAGYYDIVYSNNTAAQSGKSVTATHKTKASYILHAANFQVISGNGLGKIFHLNSPMTTFGECGSGMAGISKRKDGYFVSNLENIGTITLNDKPLGDKIVKLHHHDILVVNDTTVQFYLH
jgi:pSer/pThr/pTyr-binding forkhead associated (FHA) protein